MIYAVLIIAGLVLGSFVNALVWRLHEQARLSEIKSKKAQAKRTKLSILRGRSMCPECHHQLAAKDLVPVFSWLWLRGRCRYCHKPISVQYPAIELLTAVLFAFSYGFWPSNLHGSEWFKFALWLVFLTGFMALSVYDIRWKILPNRIIYPLIILAAAQVIILSLWQQDISVALGALWGALMLGGTFYVLFQISGGKWIGGGDVKLGALLGLLVGGPASSFLLLFLASLIGTICSLPFVLSKKLKANSQIPFGPFLIIAAIIVYIFGASIISWYKSLAYL